jgi:GAF domain-containing protein/HAMP domain-containing protein
MALAQQPALDSSDKNASYQGGLSRSLVRTLLIFTFIPLTIMAGAAFLRSRTLLREQVITQTQGLMTSQIQQMDLTVKTKNIRLDRMVRLPNISNQIDLALKTDPKSPEFNTVKDDFIQELRASNLVDGKATFNDFLLMKSDGTVLIASKPAWQGVSLKSSPVFNTLLTGNDQSYVLFNLSSLYPNQMVLATIVPYIDPNGSLSATLVGFTDSQDLQLNLLSISNLYPSSNAYFIIPDSKSKVFIGVDPYKNQLAVFQPSNLQFALLTTALDSLMGTGNLAPRALEFNSSNNTPVLAQAAWSDTMHTGIILEIQQATIYGALNSLIPFTIAIFLISLLAMGIVLSIGSTRVFRPLAKLAEITHRFAEGDFTQRAEFQSKDEIGLLSQSFNQMAEDLNNLYKSLEQKVEERTRQIRTAAEVAQRITSTTNIDEILNRTVQLIVEQFSFYQASIFMLDRGGKVAILRGSYGPAANQMLSRGHRLEVGSESIIGWVCANNQPRIASNVTEDPLHLKNDLLPETRSEAGVPIAVGGLVLGALDVQSTMPGAFGPESIILLQTLASQIAVAIQNVELAESTQVNFQELERLHRASRQIAASHSKSEALQATARILIDTPYPSVVLSVNDGHLEVAGLTDANKPEILRIRTAVNDLETGWREVQKLLSAGPVIAESMPLNYVGDRSSFILPSPLTQFPRQLGYQSTAFLPIMNGLSLVGLITVSSPKQTLTSALVQPYTNMAELIGTTLDKIAETEDKERQLSEREALATINQAVAESSNELGSFFNELHVQIRQIIGDYAFLVALYNEKTQAISIPYMYEEGRIDKIEAFPLGEGLTSILIRTGKPLLLVEDVDRRAIELGARSVGKPAKSWMGAPMIIQNKPIGAIVVQDLENEHAFNDKNLTFFVALANQVAAVINNAHIIDESRARAVQLETAAEIARDISGSLNLDELLLKAVNFIRERFNFYHSAIFLIEPQGEFAVIREATGEAGAHMKRTAHKLGVGSKSIVGYVAGRGELLIVNDTAKDATYFANPLLPNTRSEAAIPLKVGERIVGILDVQSEHPFVFTDDNLRTLQILADQLAIAVVNSELFAETQEHLSQHRLLHHITTTAASGTTLEEALDSAVTGLQVTLGGDRVAIMLADRDKKLLEVKAAVGYSEDIMQLRVPIGTGITGWAAAHHRSLRIDNVREDPRYIEGSSNTSSELAVPLIYRNEVLGVLNVESEKNNAYTENDEEMLGTLGGSLAAIIANARLLEQIRAQAERERSLYEITSKIRHSTDMQSILAITASELTKATGARHAQIKISTGEQTEEIKLKDGEQ